MPVVAGTDETELRGIKMNRSKATKEEVIIISKIANRAVKEYAEAGVKLSHLNTMMDIAACHSNGCPLRLQELLEADSFSFAHDITGIYNHINRETGELEDCFLPRFSQPEKEVK